MCCGGLQCNFVIWVKNTHVVIVCYFRLLREIHKLRLIPQQIQHNEKGDQFDALYYKVLQINVYTNKYICIQEYTLLYKNERFRIDSSMLHLKHLKNLKFFRLTSFTQGLLHFGHSVSVFRIPFTFTFKYQPSMMSLWPKGC